MMINDNNVQLVPIVAYPHKVEAGKKYLVTIDFRLDVTEQWPYEHEEHLINCILDGAPWFRCQILEDAAVVIHRFGGTYGPATFVLSVNDGIGLTVETDPEKPMLWVMLKSTGGSPLESFSLDRIQIVSVGESNSDSVSVTESKPTRTRERGNMQPDPQVNVSPLVAADSGDPPLSVRIRVVGSYASTPSQEIFDEFCRLLGQEICRRGHRLVISSTSEADGLALSGFISAALPGQVIYVQGPKSSTGPSLPDGSQVHVVYVDSDDPHRTGTVDVADVMFAVGGSGHTKTSCQIAFKHHMPVFALSQFGGTAAEFQSQVLSALESSGVPANQVKQVESERDLTKLPRLLVPLIEDWHRSRQQQLRSQRVAAICRVSGPNAQFLATGFLIEGGLLVTAHHVLRNSEEASNCEISFDDQTKFTLEPWRFFYTHEALDVTVVPIHASDDLASKLPTPILLSRPDPVLIVGDRVHIPHYTDSEHLIYSVGRVISMDHSTVRYDTVARPGGSGAPVFNEKWEILAMHRAKSFSEQGRVKYGEGVHISAIIEELRGAGIKGISPVSFSPGNDDRKIATIYELPRILHLVPTENDKSPQDATEELRQLQEVFPRRQFASATPATLGNLTSLLKSIQPNILHISGYGHSWGIEFENDINIRDFLIHKEFQELVRAAGNRLCLVVFNMSDSISLAEAFSKIVDCVIYFEGEMHPTTLTEFSSFFYRYLIAGESIAHAFAAAAARLDDLKPTLNGHYELMLRDGVDASKLRFATDHSEAPKTADDISANQDGPSDNGSTNESGSLEAAIVAGITVLDKKASLEQAEAAIGQLESARRSTLWDPTSGIVLARLYRYVNDLYGCLEVLTRTRNAMTHDKRSADIESLAALLYHRARCYSALISQSSVETERADFRRLALDDLSAAVTLLNHYAAQAIEENDFECIKETSRFGVIVQNAWTATSTPLVEHRGRIAVVGSCRHPKNPDQFEFFQNSCRELGRALSDAGFSLGVGPLTAETADFYVLVGASLADRKTDVLIVQPQDGIQHELPDDVLSRLSAQRDLVPGLRSEARTRLVAAADLVIAIGGRQGTSEMMELAHRAHKPLIPLGAFASAAEAAWPEARNALQRAGLEKYMIDKLQYDFDAKTVVGAIELLLLSDRKSVLKKAATRGKNRVPKKVHANVKKKVTRNVAKRVKETVPKKVQTNVTKKVQKKVPKKVTRIIAKKIQRRPARKK